MHRQLAQALGKVEYAQKEKAHETYSNKSYLTYDIVFKNVKKNFNVYFWFYQKIICKKFFYIKINSYLYNIFKKKFVKPLNF